MPLLTEGEVRARARATPFHPVRPAPLKTYPRGFLGSALDPRAVEQYGFSETNRGFTQRKSMAMLDQNRFDVPHPAVEEIFNAYLLDREKAKTFEFRENVYRVAMRAFGTPTFLMWFQAQYHNPSAGDSHGRFLLDTIKFFRNGRRDVSLETWASIITIDSTPNQLGRMPDAVVDYFGLGRAHAQRDVDWPSTIQHWCSQPGGFEDLVNSLHILFGAPAVV